MNLYDKITDILLIIFLYTALTIFIGVVTIKRIINKLFA
jgi:hypothetical protein